LTHVRRSEFAAAAAAAAAVMSIPARASSAGPDPVRTPSFDDAVKGIDAVVAGDRSDPLIETAAVPRFYQHGKPVEHAVVLYHGFTNCPQQFDELARGFYDRGCNVYVPRIPLHGYRDLTMALGGLTDPQLQSATTESYRLARGLGKSVTALGLSLGGAMALYLAQTQPIDHAVPVSPFLMPIGFPDWIGLAAMTAISWLPDHYTWWDPRIKEKCLPIYAYPGFPSHALAELVFFGNTVVRASKSQPPLAKRCTLVTNKNESAVNNNISFRLLKEWGQSPNGAHYDQVVLSGLGPPRHDIIDPTTFPQARTLVYPKLEAIVLGS
jgi:carboxylesterase